MLSRFFSRLLSTVGINFLGIENPSLFHQLIDWIVRKSRFFNFINCFGVCERPENVLSCSLSVKTKRIRWEVEKFHACAPRALMFLFIWVTSAVSSWERNARRTWGHSRCFFCSSHFRPNQTTVPAQLSAETFFKQNGKLFVTVLTAHPYIADALAAFAATSSPIFLSFISNASLAACV